MRLFIAVMVSGECRNTLTNTLELMKQNGITGRFVPEENLHITLAFIGEYGSPEPVIDALSRISFQPFEIELSGTGMFGDTLWAGVKDHDKLRVLADQIRQELSSAGIPYDRKDFVPHITLVRRMKGSVKEYSVQPCHMTVGRISLMNSDLSSGSPHYSEISSFGNAG
ncbi:MAG: RNA 2',3'-cyclic phosphodiesterase [Erysipelotrichaceae bacterium]|nr:RNA 2',3'-cyclic phosphodiesterase [Erysipelotrichaceae bacterium]